jgi:hypothetical protein
MKMTAFQKAEALAGQRYDRDKLLAMVHEVTAHFRMPNSFERSKMRGVCRYLVDALDRCNGSTLQQRWNDFEKRFWPKWKAGINRPGGTYWTWGARVLISACGVHVDGCGRRTRPSRANPRDGHLRLAGCKDAVLRVIEGCASAVAFS